MYSNRLVPWIAGGAIGAAVVFVAGANVRGALPLFAILACPLMMILMMRGHGGHAGHGGGREHGDHSEHVPPPSMR